MQNRVVVTGLGVVAPNGIGLDEFDRSLRLGISGIKYEKSLADLNIACSLAGIPSIGTDKILSFCDTYRLSKLRSTAILYGCMAGVEAWRDAGLDITKKKSEKVLSGTGCIFGTSSAGMDAFEYSYKLTRGGNVRKVGGRIAQQAMNSGISAYLGGIFGFGNQVTTNASEASTGTESILLGYYRIHWGLADRMLVGSTESGSPYFFGAYDSITADNERPATYRPLNGSNLLPSEVEVECRNQRETLGGIIAGAGSGALVLESLRSAKRRKAKIYAEIVGGYANSGGQINGGGMTSSNPEALKSCILTALEISGISSNDINLFTGQFQSNYCDHVERDVVGQIWQERAPYLIALKPFTANCLSAAGSIETVGTILSLHNGYVPSLLLGQDSVPKNMRKQISQDGERHAKMNLNASMALKLSYGVGDVNSCLLIKKWVNEKKLR